MKELRATLAVGQGVIVIIKGAKIQRGKVTAVDNRSNATHGVTVKLDKENVARPFDPTDVGHDYGIIPKHWSFNGIPKKMQEAA